LLCETRLELDPRCENDKAVDGPPTIEDRAPAEDERPLLVAGKADWEDWPPIGIPELDLSSLESVELGPGGSLLCEVTRLVV
jgi:hypothetical protein